MNSSEEKFDDPISKCNIKCEKANLNLMKICIPEIPNDILFPDELNRYLRDQIQYLTLENGMLHKNNTELEEDLKSKKLEIQTLSNELVQYKSCSTFNNNGQLVPTNVSNIATGKIFELSRKLREKTVEVESVKAKCTKLEKHIKTLELETMKEHAKQIPEKEDSVNEIENKLKCLTEKLQITNTKLFETKNANALLKNEIKLANKLLQQEIGDNFTTIQNLSQSNWRGRAQQIIGLQQKNMELIEKLKSASFVVAVPSTQNIAKVEELSNEINSLKQSAQEYKNKLEVSKSKRRMMDMEFASFKTRVINLTEQASRDQQIIDNLTKQLTSASEMHRNSIKEKQGFCNKTANENKNLKIELEKLQCKLSLFTKQLEQEKQSNDDKEQQYFPQNNSQRNIDANDMRKLEVEKMKLLELMKILNGRIEEERNLRSEIQQNYHIERQKAAKLESKLARLQLDLSTDRSSVYSRSKLEDEPEYVLKNKLELAQERILALQTRLQIEQNERKNDMQEFSKIIQMHSKVPSM